MEKALKAAGAWFGQHLRRERPFFEDRETAGRMLAARLMQRTPLRPVVYALPRGGVPVAIEIARLLNTPLDLLLVRKIGAPGQPELAAGAVVDGEQPDIVVNEEICRASGLRPSDIAALGAAPLKVIERRRALYLPGKAPAPARGRTAILVDDGVATGASMEAAIAAVRRRSPERIFGNQEESPLCLGNFGRPFCLEPRHAQPNLAVVGLQVQLHARQTRKLQRFPLEPRVPR